MSAAHLRRLALVTLAVLSTSCSGNLTSLEELSRGADTSGGLFFSEEELASAIAEAQPAPAVSGPLSDSIAADAIAAELQTAGIDMTGIRVSVWPLTGDGRTLLVLNLTEETPLFSGAEQGASENFEDALFSTLVNGRAAREAGVARFAFRFTGQVEQEPVEVVFAVTMEDIEDSLRTGADPLDRALVQIEGGPSV